MPTPSCSASDARRGGRMGAPVAVARYPGLLHHLGQERLHRVGPDLVARDGGVQVVGHDRVGIWPSGPEEFRADVEVAARSAVVERGERRVDRVDDHHPLAVVVLGAVAVLARSAREDRQEEDLRLREPARIMPTILLSAAKISSALLLPALLVPIIRTTTLGMDAVEFAMLDAPDDVLGRVAADAEIGRVVLPVVALSKCPGPGSANCR